MRRNASSQRNTTIGEQASIVIPAVQDINDMKSRTDAKSTENVLYNPNVSKATMEESIVKILPGELVFRVGNHRRRSVQSSAGSMIECSSYTNGLYIPKNQIRLSLYQDAITNQVPLPKDVAADLERYALMENLQFVGVARTETNPNPSPDYAGLEKTIFSAQIHGTTTIRHTGTKAIAPGDIIGFELMSESQAESYKLNVVKDNKPIHPEKIPPRVATLDEMFTDVGAIALKLLPIVGNKQIPKLGDYDSVNGPIELASSIANLISFLQYKDSLTSPGQATMHDFNTWKQNNNGFDIVASDLASNPAFAFVINELVNSFQYMLKDYNRRKIGKALSYAEPGDRVDVLLGV